MFGRPSTAEVHIRRGQLALPAPGRLRPLDTNKVSQPTLDRAAWTVPAGISICSSRRRFKDPTKITKSLNRPVLQRAEEPGRFQVSQRATRMKPKDASLSDKCRQHIAPIVRSRLIVMVEPGLLRVVWWIYIYILYEQFKGYKTNSPNPLQLKR